MQELMGGFGRDEPSKMGDDPSCLQDGHGYKWERVIKP